MSFFTPVFLIFILAGLIVYHIVPAGSKWCILLGLSMFYYCFGGIAPVIFLLITCLTVWMATCYMDSDRQKVKQHIAELKNQATDSSPAPDGNTAGPNTHAAGPDTSVIKAQAKRRYRLVLISVLIVNIGILAYLKYFTAIAGFLASLAGSKGMTGAGALILPLGISFYTFSAIGYTLDVYGGYVRAERNPLKLLLFLSFFPQIVQGPIARFNKLSPQLFAGKKFDIRDLENGAILILWGMFKKLVIADRAITVIEKVFADPASIGRGEVFLFNILLYSAWQYADFSGGIDMVTGVAQMFGIGLDENFKRPYFATSISDFWRRWHISLGNWMRDYVFFPLSMSRPIVSVGKRATKGIGENAGRMVPVTICSVLTFVLVGIWHGPYMHYVIWGLYNGILISVERCLEPASVRFRQKHGISDSNVVYRIFTIVRTFILVNLGWFFDGAAASDAVYMLTKVFTDFSLSGDSLRFMLTLGLEKADYCKLIFAIAILFTVSLLQENGVKIRESLWRLKLPLRWGILYALFFGMMILSVSQGGLSGFAYAQF